MPTVANSQQQNEQTKFLLNSLKKSFFFYNIVQQNLLQRLSRNMHDRV